MRTDKVVTLGDLARKYKVEPKTARRRLRNTKGKLPKSVGNNRWCWKKSDMPIIGKVITGEYVSD